MKWLKVLGAVVAIPVLVVVLWNALTPPSLAERGLALAIVERDMILEELPEPEFVIEGPTSAEPCGWLFGCRTVSEAEAASRNPVDGRFFIRFGPFQERASIEASAAQIRSRLEDVGHEFVCTRDFGGRPEQQHRFREPTDTYFVTIVDPGETEGRVDLLITGRAEPRPVTFSCEESP